MIPDAVRAIAQEQPARPIRLRSEIGRDLDAIVMTAMAKDRERRYADVNALAADLRRYLNREPIEARPVSAPVQLLRFAQRNRPLAASVAAAVLLLVVGATTATWLAYAATRARDEARERGHELELAASFLEDQLAGLDVRELGESIRTKLVDAIRDLDPGSEPPPSLQAVNFTSIALRSVDDRVLSRFRRDIDRQFAERPLLRARLLQQLAGTTHRLGLSPNAEPPLREALAIRTNHLGPEHPDTLQTMHALGSLLTALGRYADAVELLTHTHQLRARLDEALRIATDTHDAVGAALSGAAPTERWLRGATGSTLGDLLNRAGKEAQAREVLQAAHTLLAATLGPQHVQTRRAAQRLARLDGHEQDRP